ncbi:MAG: uracil-DNA glycosylase family protein [Salibacteraceae bacterium]
MVSNEILEFLLNLKSPTVRTSGVKTMNPFENESTRKLVQIFFTKYYSDSNKRLAFIGINPGRLGSGLTGVGFTDPLNLEENCGVKNDFAKKHELSSKFVYDMIDAFGGVDQFYEHVYITSVVPLGFTKDAVNLNYYDIKELEMELTPYIKEQFKKQLPFLRRDVAFCIGKGKNLKFLNALNKQEGYFEKIEVLPHPRWVMQYRLKRKQEFVDQFVSIIGSYI